MIVLGITETHCATAAILRDGAIVGCASEERFTRLKNDAGYPRRAIDALLRQCGIAPRDIDLVALAGTQAYPREWMNRVLHDARRPRLPATAEREVIDSGPIASVPRKGLVAALAGQHYLHVLRSQPRYEIERHAGRVCQRLVLVPHQ